MSTVPEIEDSIRKLPPEEFAALVVFANAG